MGYADVADATNMQGHDGQIDGAIIAVEVPPGHFIDVNRFKACPEGTFEDPRDHHTTCRACELGKPRLLVRAQRYPSPPHPPPPPVLLLAYT